MADDPIIEPSAIADLRALSPDAGPEFLRELIEIYFQDIPERFAEIDRGLAKPDAILVARAAHTIKGSSSNFGAKRLAKVAHEMELSGKAGDIAAASANYGRLRTEYELVSSGLKQVLADL